MVLPTALCKGFLKCRREEFFCDVTLKVEDEKFNLHKFMLASASNYFMVLFTSEVLDENQKEIELREVTPLAVKTCVEHIYSGIVDVDLDKIHEILYAACLFQLWDLKTQCFATMEKKLSIYNCVDYWELALKFESTKFKIADENFLWDNVGEILEKSQQFDESGIAFIQMFLQLNNYKYADEVLFYEALVRWIKQDLETRRSMFCGLLQLVRLPVMSSEYLCETVSDNPWISECNSCNRYLVQSLGFQLTKKIKQLQETQIAKREATNILVVFGLMDTDISLYHCHLDLKEISYKYSIKCTNIFDCSWSPICVTANCLFLINNDSCIWSYSINNENSQWEKKAKLIDKKFSFSIIANKNYVFVIGGINDRLQKVTTVQRYNIVTNVIEKINDLNVARANLISAIVGNNLYAIGGNTVSVEKLDLMGEDVFWDDTLAPLQVERKNAVAESAHNTIYVLGGDRSPNTMEFYTETKQSNVWTLVQIEFVHPRTGYDVFVYNDKLFVIGGSIIIQNIEEYDENSNTWRVSLSFNLTGNKKFFGKCRAFATR